MTMAVELLKIVLSDASGAHIKITVKISMKKNAKSYLSWLDHLESIKRNRSFIEVSFRSSEAALMSY